MASDNEIIQSAVKLVNEGLRVTFPVKGYSMLPFIIGGKESVDLVKPEGLQVGHVVLAWVEGSRYVVHRIVSIDGEKVVLMGDGNIAGTEHCDVADVKAKAVYVVDSRGRRRPLYSKWRSRGAQLWYRLRPVRRSLLALYRML